MYNKEFPIYVINLERSTDRLADIDGRLKKLELNYKTIKAIDGKALTSTQRKEHSSNMCNTFCTDSMIGCFLSHSKAWETVIKNKDEYALILEDDCELISSFNKEAYNVLNEVQEIDPEWDFIYGGYFLNLFSDTSEKNKLQYVFKPDKLVGFHCYFISLKGAYKLRKYVMEKDGAKNHVDLTFLNQRHHFSRYASKLKLGEQAATAEQSTQIDTSYPVTFNTLIKNTKFTDVDLTYLFQAPVGQVMSIPVNLYLIIYIISLILLASGLPLVSKKNIFIVIYSFLLIELVLNVKNIKHILTYFVIAHLVLFCRK